MLQTAPVSGAYISSNYPVMLPIDVVIGLSRLGLLSTFNSILMSAGGCAMPGDITEIINFITQVLMLTNRYAFLRLTRPRRGIHLDLKFSLSRKCLTSG